MGNFVVVSVLKSSRSAATLLFCVRKLLELASYKSLCTERLV